MWKPLVGEVVGVWRLTSMDVVERKKKSYGIMEIDRLRQYVFACVCGNGELKLYADELPEIQRNFKAQYQHCGCGSGPVINLPVKDAADTTTPARLRSRKTSIAASIDREIAIWIHERAREQRRPVSWVVNEMLAIAVSALS